MKMSQRAVSLLVIILGLVFCFKTAKADVLASLETKGLSFISPDYENTKSSTFGFFGAVMKSDDSVSDSFKLNLKAMYAMGAPVLSYLNLSELYFNYQIDSTSEIQIGRKINVWSRVDELWNLGFFQPQFRWNSLHPESQGLTGFFWNKKKNNFDFLLFASPVFIPDQGPGYVLINGQFESNNPWFLSPPQNILFQNQILPIDYKIETPNISDVIFQPHFGLQMKYGDQSKGVFASLSSMYKPSHQMALGYKGVLVTDHVSITILPKTYYENLIAADIGYASEVSVVDISVLHSRPKSPDFDVNYNKPVLFESTSLSPHISLKANSSLSFEAKALITFGEDIIEIGPDSNPSRQTLTTKYIYRNAYELSGMYQSVFKNKFKMSNQIIWR